MDKEDMEIEEPVSEKETQIVDQKITIFSAVKRALGHVERRGLYNRGGKKSQPERNKDKVKSREDNGKGNVTTVIVRESVSRMINVEYPGIVDNPSKALRTLGGAVRVSEVFHHPPRKLELKYRPAEIFCNSISGTGRTTCGLLIKVRRRKRRRISLESETVNKLENNLVLIDLDGDEKSGEGEELFNPSELLDPSETIISIPLDSEHPSAPVPENIKEQERNALLQKLLEEEEKVRTHAESQFAECDHDILVKKLNRNKDISAIESTISIPRGEFNLPETDIKLEPLGVINKIYEFNGLSDFQYLPMTRQKNGEFVSIVDDVFPSFGDPDNGILYDAVDMENGVRPSRPFFLPVNMSKFDRPIQNLYKSMKQDASQLVLEDDTEVNSTRTKRSVYTHMMNFRWDEDETSEPIIIPRDPYPHAIEDCKSKMLTGQKLDTVTELFIQRPIWTKLALEHETKIMAEHLKYILPCVAYFSLNGPWRSLWIRLGYDPRKDKNAFIYQLVDYRFPVEYRGHLDLDQDNQEGYHKFKPERIPPKSQMFYQFCDVLVPEIQELEGALTMRFNSSETVDYDPKYGFLNEDVMEFCRYCMSRCIEVRLHNLGKIRSVVLEQIRLGPGGTIPTAQLKIKPRKQPKKRIRTNASNKSKTIKTAKPEAFSFTFEESVDVHSEPKIQNLTDFFDDDEEEEEENEDDIEENQDPLRNLQDCFDDDEIEEIEEDDTNNFKLVSDKT